MSEALWDILLRHAEVNPCSSGTSMKYTFRGFGWFRRMELISGRLPLRKSLRGFCANNDYGNHCTGAIHGTSMDRCDRLLFTNRQAPRSPRAYLPALICCSVPSWQTYRYSGTQWMRSCLSAPKTITPNKSLPHEIVAGY